MKNRNWMLGGGAVIAAAVIAYGMARGGSGDAREHELMAASVTRSADATLVTLYKNPTCSCCADWADHMREEGFRVEVREGADLIQVKAEYGVPLDLASCHTAAVDGYAVEGDVPADVVRAMLVERPEIAGLAVPGMPRGVPGMPGEGLGSYQVLAFQTDGARDVYAVR